MTTDADYALLGHVAGVATPVELAPQVRDGDSPTAYRITRGSKRGPAR